MFKSLIAAAVSLSVLATSAHAYTVVSTEKVTGVVSSVNASAKTLTLVAESGDASTYTIGESTKVVLDNGQKSTLESIQVGQTVVLKCKVKTETSEEIKGSLVSVDADSRTITLRDSASKQIVSLMLSEKVVVKGAEENAITALKAGQDVVVRRESI